MSESTNVDPILLSRLESLERSLDRMSQITTFAQNLDWRDLITAVERERWQRITKRLVDDVMDQVNDVRNKLKAIKSELRTAAAAPKVRAQVVQRCWLAYQGCYDTGQELFRECLDIFGGLAFRDRSFRDETFRKDIDTNILRVAEELIWACSDFVRSDPSLVMPAPREELAATVGRILRLRCCDWTIWLLPLIAHELGHVVIKEPKFEAYFDKAIIAPFRPELLPFAGPAGPDQRKRAEIELQEYVADALATYVMGPAFCCAAIHLRLSPYRATASPGEVTTDEGRAHVMLQMLGKMGEVRSARVQEFGEIAGDLGKVWAAMLADARRLGSGEETTKKRVARNKKMAILDRVVEASWEQFERLFFLSHLSRGRYRDHIEGTAGSAAVGWSVAKRWGGTWIGEIEGGSDLSRPSDVTGDSELRDVLNAAWHARRKCPEPATPERIRSIADKAGDICRFICDERRKFEVGWNQGVARRLPSEAESRSQAGRPYSEVPA
jgi:hypothetical protein